MTDGVDLRLAPAALSAWLASGLAVGGSAGGAAAGAVGAGLVAAVVVLRGRHHPEATGLRTAALALAVTAALLTVCAVHLDQRSRGVLPGLVEERAAVTVLGVVRSEAVPLPPRAGGWDDDLRVRVVLDVEEVTGRGRTSGAAAPLVMITGVPATDLVYGATIRGDGRLAPTERGERASGLLLAHRVEQVGPPGPVDRQVARLRTALLDVTDGLPADQRGLVPGAAIGDTRRLPDDLATAMRHTGLTHITAVSGGHFSVLTVTTLGLASLLRVPVLLRVLAAGAVMTGFVVLVHPEPSVVRAAGMGGLAMVALLAGRPSRAVPALATTVVVLLLLDPWLARAYGFVLSVAATAAIVLLAPALARRTFAALPRQAALLLSVPTAAQAVCGPVLILLDPAVLPYAVPANALAAPALVPATVLGTVATVLAPSWPGPAEVVAGGAGWATWWIALVARSLAGAPGAHTPWPAGVGGAALLALLTTVALLVLLRPSWRSLAVLVLSGLLAVGVVREGHRWVPGSGVPPDWDVVVCDVGQGDALLVRSGPEAAVMIDVGPDGSAARCLTEVGVRRLDLLVLTHPHADHVAGLSAVLAGREVARAVVSPVRTPGGAEREVLETLEAADVPTDAGLARTSDGAPSAASGGVAGSVTWEVLGPVADDAEPAREAPAVATGESAVVNDASVVLLLDTGDLRVLALGDLEPGGQDDLLGRLRTQGRVRPAEVVKIAHHGSAHQSAELARWLAPTVGLVSAGADNAYGHPARGTVTLYRDVGARVLSTHTCGRIVLTADPRGVVVTGRCAGPER